MREARAGKRWSATLACMVLATGNVEASQLIVNARVIDGTGAAARVASVRIEGDRIVGVGALSPQAGEEVIDARGRVLAPGFIDTHSHHDMGLLEARDARTAVSQGITTIVVGQDGGSNFPLSEFFGKLERTPANVNVASYSGHGSLRAEVLGEDFRRRARPEEVARMLEVLEKDLEAGALGLSSGLEYEPGSYATTEELIALARLAAANGGRYISHMRSEDIRLDAAIEELLRIGEEACLPVQISHFKIALRSRWGEAKALLRRLDAARARGVDVSADVYPYEAWQSTLRVLFPERDYADRRAAEFALEHLAAPEDLKLSEFEPEPALVGKTVAEIARQRGTDPATTLMDLIRQAQSFGSHGGKEMVIGRSMSEADIAQILAWSHTNVSSDGLLVDEHPRGAGSFTKVLRVFVREKRLLTIEEAVHKMTALSAAHVGITDRGVIREGAFADLVLFDPDRVADRSTEEEPGKLSVGVERVWVNGRTVWTSQGTTSEFAGRVLRRPPDAAPFKCARAGHRD